MASGFFAILDDIAALMDDVAVASKIATKKTAGILGDDLAVNADKATGFVSSRELPVLWAITKGSLINKVIIVPIALLLNYFLPVAIKIILVLGGLYLAFEGVEKIIHYFFHKKEHSTTEDFEEEPMNITPEQQEKEKIKSAISTDFILSVEIVIIALGSVLDRPLAIQILTVCVVALIATVGVYGIVAMIVRMDDLGLKMITKSNNKGFMATIGNVLVRALPVIIRVLSVVGTIALILVAGGIFAHNIPAVHHWVEQFSGVPNMLLEALAGVLGGLLVFLLVSAYQKLFTAKKQRI